MSAPQVTIALVPREQFGTTRRTLETLYQRTTEPFELVCIDGGSPPAVADYLAQAARERQFTLIRSESYLTPNQARNLALPHVRTPYVVFVDNDVLVAEGWLAPLVECAEETGAWVVAPLYFEFEPECERLHMFGGDCRIDVLPDGRRDYYEKHHFAHQRIADVKETLTRRRTELVEFHSLFASMELFRQLGPLDEGLLCNAEHGDLCLAVRNAGREVWLEPRSRITYAPPKTLAGADLEYFRLRWSEAWGAANNRRLQEKWNLAPDAPGLTTATRWVAGHRRYSLAWLPKLKRIFGRKIAHFLEKRVIAPREVAANKRQFPVETYGKVASPRTRVVYSPPADRRRAA